MLNITPKGISSFILIFYARQYTKKNFNEKYILVYITYNSDCSLAELKINICFYMRSLT